MKYNILGFSVESDIDLVFYKDSNEITTAVHNIRLSSGLKNTIVAPMYKCKVCHYLLYDAEFSVTHMENDTLVVLKDYFWAKITYDSETNTVVTYKRTARCSDIVFAEVFLTEILTIIMKRLGRYVIHGGLFEYMSKKFLVLGCGGAGKSSFITAACNSGATFLSDDMVPVVLRDDGVYAYPGHLFYKLCVESISDLIGANNSFNTYNTGEKIAYRIEASSNTHLNECSKIDYILTLQRSNQEKRALSRMCVMDVYKQLLGSQICGFANNNTEMYEYLHIVQRAAQIPSFQYSYPNGIALLYSNVNFFFELIANNMTTSCTLYGGIEK